jgi:metal-dependent amidase/aminoacylase/carboxypeptidase family protein
MNGNELLSRWNRFLKDDPGVRWPEMWTSVVLENWMEENGIE